MHMEEAGLVEANQKMTPTMEEEIIDEDTYEGMTKKKHYWMKKKRSNKPWKIMKKNQVV